jgi:hypothetical protein
MQSFKEKLFYYVHFKYVYNLCNSIDIKNKMDDDSNVKVPLLINSNKKKRYAPISSSISTHKIKKKFLCKCLIIAIVSLTFLFILGCYLNLKIEYKYQTVFQNIKITSNYEEADHFYDDLFLMPKINFLINDKKFRLEHRRLIDPNRKLAYNTFSRIVKFIIDFISSPINKIKHDYLHDSYFRLIDKNGNRFKVEKINTKNNAIKCFSMHLSNDQQIKNQAFETCFELGDNYWFGGHESYNQPYWPINNQSFDYVAYVTGYPDEWGAMVERYWLGSNGISIFVDDDVPLFVRHVENKICLKSSNFTPPYLFTNMIDKLEYKICMGEDIKGVHLYSKIYSSSLFH